jgi:hypothetical protein
VGVHVDGFSYLYGFSVIILSNKNHPCFSELALNPTMPVGLVSTNQTSSHRNVTCFSRIYLAEMLLALN